MSGSTPPGPSDRRAVADAEIAAEQHHVDAVYLRLDEAAKAAQALADEGHGRARLGHEGGLVERDAMVYQAAKRIAALDAAHEGLVFGRLDLVDGEARYIGRIGLRDAEREVMLVDWRAPAATVFYQATAQEPAGVVRRRVLRCRGASVVGVEDDLLDAGNAPDGMVVVGDGALMAQLTRARDSVMHSVVATIQKEQDEAIRAPSRGVTTIGGGPGTGKTVVALHRAAYLLYTDRRRFESGGVLVIGPSGVFMGYIERVLPSLGETSVTLRSLGHVVDGVEASEHDTPAAAVVKGSARMEQLLARAARDAAPDEPVEFRWFYRDDVLRASAGQLRSIRRRLLGSGQQRNRMGGRARRQLLDLLWRQVTGERGREDGKTGFLNELEDSSELTAFMAAWWPRLDAVEVWQWLRDPRRLAEYAQGLLSDIEVETLLESWAASPEQPTVEDVPLIDELRYLIGDLDDEVDDSDRDSSDVRQLMSFERDDAERRLRTTTRTEDDSYAHVLVDEAQDLSPMQWRMLGRRGRYSSWTIVGDQAQSSWPLPVEAAQARTRALGDKPEYSFRLSTNYRNSAEIYDFAAEVARVHVPDADMPNAVRRTGAQPEHRAAEHSEVEATVLAAIREVASAVDGTIAVVVPVSRRGEVRRWLDTLPTEVVTRASVLHGLDTKGLEFDAVVVVEPAAIVAESPTGWRTLYVVLTRATQRLITVGVDGSWLDDLKV
ncbi:MAG: HelD family protein [Nocardioidaceae bacterium]